LRQIGSGGESRGSVGGNSNVRTPKTSDIIERELKDYNTKLGDHLKSDALIIKSPIRFGLDDAIRSEVENLYPKRLTLSKRSETLSVLIETNGGYIEVVERIYNVFRKHYKLVNFIVPNYAYSAGTVLVLSGDEIYMDYYSVLGPIDPQMENENDRFVSGLGYLAKFQELTTAINSASSPDEVRAELAYLLKKFDPAELFDLEQARSHSEDLLEQWLSTHKFKDWKETETQKKPVTDVDRKARARAIAETLGDPMRWHSHGRGIGLKELGGDDIKLKVVNFGEDTELNEKIRSYYEFFIDYCKKMGVNTLNHTVLHSRNGIRRL
jgi:Serine dehydrogenase proteinase